jgi:hypothetical protein
LSLTLSYEQNEWSNRWGTEEKPETARRKGFPGHKLAESSRALYTSWLTLKLKGENESCKHAGEKKVHKGKPSGLAMMECLISDSAISIMYCESIIIDSQHMFKLREFTQARFEGLIPETRERQ